MMLKEMRRAKQMLKKEEIIAVLLRNTSGVLALVDEDGYPYAVPLSYVYVAGKLYFHCANSGHKIDALRFCDKASFCVIDRDDVIPAAFATKYISVIAFGKAHVMDDEEEKRVAIGLIADKYGNGDPDLKAREIEKSWNALCIVEFDIEHLTGKAASAVIKDREAFFPQRGKACSCVSQ